MSQRIHLDATPGLFHQVLHCHQGDVGRQFEIAVVTRDGYEIPSGATFKIQATKPSGLGFTVTGTAANNIISFTSTEDMTSEAGEIPTQLEIKSGNDVIYTSNFLLVCEKNTHPASITDGSPEEIISEITLLVERAESAASTAGADAAAAAQARVDEMMDYLPSEVANLKSESKLARQAINISGYTFTTKRNIQANGTVVYLDGWSAVLDFINSGSSRITIQNLSSNRMYVAFYSAPNESSFIERIEYSTNAVVNYERADGNPFFFRITVNNENFTEQSNLLFVRIGSCAYLNEKIDEEIENLQNATINSSAIGLWSQADVTSHSDYSDLDTAPMNQTFYIGLGAVPYISNYPVKFQNGAMFLTAKYHKQSVFSGSIQIAYSADGQAYRINNGSWSAWRYILENDSANYVGFNLTSDTVIDQNAVIVSNQWTTGFEVTDYIPVKIGQKISIGYVKGTGNLAGGVVFDANKQPLYPIGYDKLYNGAYEFVVEDYRAKYVRVNIVNNAALAKIKNYVFVNDVHYPILIKDLYVSKSATVAQRGNNVFTSLLECAKYISDNEIKDARVHVSADNYDLANEFGSDFLDNYDGASRYVGVPFGNNTHWIFAEGAKVTFDYNGSNTNVPNLFSPTVISGSCVLENLNIEVANCQYCVHDDWEQRESNWIIRYINCNMKHNGNSFGTFTDVVCIGGGLLPNELIVVDGGQYECPTAFNYPISYHSIWGNMDGNIYPSKIIFKDIWLSGGFRLQDAPYNSNSVSVTIMGCSQGTTIGGTHTKFAIKEWNNIVRS